MTDESEPGYSLVVRFPDQSASFAQGVQTGVAWERIKALGYNETLEHMVVTEIKEVLESIAQYEKCDVIWEEAEVAEWVLGHFTKRKPFTPHLVV